MWLPYLHGHFVLLPPFYVDIIPYDVLLDLLSSNTLTHNSWHHIREVPQYQISVIIAAELY